jgi:cell division protein FtsQ
MKWKLKIKNPLDGLGKFKKFVAPVLLAVTLLILASFADKQHSISHCKKITVNILDDDDYQFVSKRDILRAINSGQANDLVGRKMSQIDLLDVEKNIKKNSFVKDAQVFFDMHGDLVAKVHQRVPYIRVIDPLSQSYYLDNDGKRMPLSEEYTAFVPLATADYANPQGRKDSILKAMDSSLFVMASYMQQDSFSRAICGQIIIEPDNELTIIPRLGNFEIFMGDVSDLDDKFTRLKSFYATMIPQVGWDTYKKISLKYKNQIIANR